MIKLITTNLVDRLLFCAGLQLTSLPTLFIISRDLTYLTQFIDGVTALTMDDSRAHLCLRVHKSAVHSVLNFKLTTCTVPGTIPYCRKLLLEEKSRELKVVRFFAIVKSYLRINNNGIVPLYTECF